MICAPSKDSDQPGHPPSLISLRCALNRYLRTLAFFMRTVKTDQTGRMQRLGGCPGWTESSLGAHAISLVLAWGGSNLLTTQGKSRLWKLWYVANIYRSKIISPLQFLKNEKSLKQHLVGGDISLNTKSQNYLPYINPLFSYVYFLVPNFASPKLLSRYSRRSVVSAKLFLS